MITFILYALLMFLLFQYRNISNYLYISKCFKFICKDSHIRHHYKVAIDDVSVPNPRKTVFNVLYFYVVVPGDMPYQYVETFLNGHMKLVNEVFLNMDLTGLISADKDEFVYTLEENNEKQYRYIVKFKPDISFFRFKLMLIYLGTLFSTWFVFKFFEISKFFTHQMFSKLYDLLFS